MWWSWDTAFAFSLCHIGAAKMTHVKPNSMMNRNSPAKNTSAYTAWSQRPKGQVTLCSCPLKTQTHFLGFCSKQLGEPQACLLPGCHLNGLGRSKQPGKTLKNCSKNKSFSTESVTSVGKLPAFSVWLHRLITIVQRHLGALRRSARQCAPSFIFVMLSLPPQTTCASHALVQSYLLDWTLFGAGIVTGSMFAQRNGAQNQLVPRN
ncbi:hypothetical protein KIL84_002360 [Mauremys mutica]|uniref:Secreted protein n=1 Tax=Mauremys mutica TaxID=74926 RepID=A0A9D3X6N1_9SAUR|nr:hypothetical protein KIL84_002360 [Mauremys mutica]